jgi:hypothetical protein
VYPTPGSYTARVTVRMTTWANGTATADVTVTDTPPEMTVTLQAAPRSALPDVEFTLTADVSKNATAGDVVDYVWDFDTATTADLTRTTVTNTTTVTYPTIGNRGLRVTARTANGTTATATETLSVTAPALNVILSASSASVPVSTALTLTAAVAVDAGAVPGVLTFEWDFDNNGTVDETTSGTSPRAVSHIYNTSGAKIARVTVKADDGRTATNTVAVTVTP